jgi:type I restriction enzyme S subunit
LSPYLNYYLNTVSTQARLKGIATRGVSQSNISAGRLKTFQIPLPSLGEQREIANVLVACDATIAAIEQEMLVEGELFRAMLEDLMTGRLSSQALLN